MKRIRSLVWLLPIVLIVVACNKTDRYNNILVKGHTWKIYDEETEVNTDVLTSCLVVDQSSFDNQDEFGSATWRHTDGSEQSVTWRFWRAASTFEFWHQGDLDQGSRASLQSYYRSGIYDVISLSNTEIVIQSEETIGYEGKMITITIIRG